MRERLTFLQASCSDFHVVSREVGENPTRSRHCHRFGESGVSRAHSTTREDAHRARAPTGEGRFLLTSESQDICLQRALKPHGRWGRAVALRLSLYPVGNQRRTGLGVDLEAFVSIFVFCSWSCGLWRNHGAPTTTSAPAPAATDRVDRGRGRLAEQLRERGDHHGLSLGRC